MMAVTGNLSFAAVLFPVREFDTVVKLVFTHIHTHTHRH